MNIRAAPTHQSWNQWKESPRYWKQLRCVLKSRSCLTRIPRANKRMDIRAHTTPPQSSNHWEQLQMRIVSWVSDSRSFLTKIPRTSDTHLLDMVTIHTSAKAKEFKHKFNGFSKTQKLGVGRGGILHILRFNLSLRSLALLRRKCKNPSSSYTLWSTYVSVHDNLCLLLYEGQGTYVTSFSTSVILSPLFWQCLSPPLPSPPTLVISIHILLLPSILIWYQDEELQLNNWALKSSCSSALKPIEEGLGGQEPSLTNNQGFLKGQWYLGVEIVETTLVIKVLPVHYIFYGLWRTFARTLF
jgi:hypothetical protein